MNTTALNPSFGITDSRSPREVRQDARNTMRELLQTFDLPEQGADVFTPEPVRARQTPVHADSQPASSGGLLKTVLAGAAVLAGLFLLIQSQVGQDLFAKVSESVKSLKTAET